MHRLHAIYTLYMMQHSFENIFYTYSLLVDHILIYNSNIINLCGFASFNPPLFSIDIERHQIVSPVDK